MTANGLKNSGSRFFSEQLRPATASDCKGRWNGGKPGEYFRCGFCGHKFTVGDLYRPVYTNDMPGADGNPLVCEQCNADTTVLRERWKAKWTVMRQDFWWWLRE